MLSPARSSFFGHGRSQLAQRRIRSPVAASKKTSRSGRARAARTTRSTPGAARGRAATPETPAPAQRSGPPGSRHQNLTRRKSPLSSAGFARAIPPGGGIGGGRRGPLRGRMGDEVPLRGSIPVRVEVGPALHHVLPGLDLLLAADVVGDLLPLGGGPLHRLLGGRSSPFASLVFGQSCPGTLNIPVSMPSLCLPMASSMRSTVGGISVDVRTSRKARSAR